jgi:glycosyltransferase involved in cell wall biosynthesis
LSTASQLNGARVAFVITRMIIGGAQETVLETARRLKARGVDCELITGPETGPEGTLFDEVRQASIPLHIAKDLVREVDPAKDLRAVIWLWRLCRNRGYSIVHTNSSKAGVVGRLAARLAGVPVVVHSVHGYAFNEYQSPIERSIYLFLEQLGGRLAHHLIAVSRPILQRSIRYRIAPRDKVSLVYSGIDVSAYRSRDYPSTVRSELGLPAGATVIGCVARLVDGKGHHDLLHAFARVHERRSDTCLVLVGDGRLRAELEALTSSLDISSAVHFLGLRRDVPRLLRAFDVFVLASLWEGMGRVLLEAMASDNAVIATRVGGIVDLIQDGMNGLLAEPNDPDSLAVAMLRLIDYPDLREELARRGTAFVGEEFSIDRTADAILGLYKTLLKSKRAHAAVGSAHA